MVWVFGLKNMLIVLSTLPTFNFILNLMLLFLSLMFQSILVCMVVNLRNCAYEWHKWKWSTIFLTVILSHAQCLLYQSPRSLPPGMSFLHYQSDESTESALKVMKLTGSKLHAKMTGNPHTHNFMSGSGRSKTFTSLQIICQQLIFTFFVCFFFWML